MTAVALVFPGQGSQTLGMLAALAAENPLVASTFQEASEILKYDLWKITQEGPAEELNKTSRTQPALLAASVAVYRVWKEKTRMDPKWPMLLAGHSLGEYSALVCAGVLHFSEAINLVAIRGKLMQEAMPEGTSAMSAIIGLDDTGVGEACREAAKDQVVSPANFNSPGQVVIAGHRAAVERASEICLAKGARRVFPLPVSVPSHCSLMKPAADRFLEALEKVSYGEPEVPVLNNVDVKCEKASQSIRDALYRQLFNPVRWTESVLFMAKQGVTSILEIGPGNVLTGLTKRIDRSLSAKAINAPESLHG